MTRGGGDSCSHVGCKLGCELADRRDGGLWLILNSSSFVGGWYRSDIWETCMWRLVQLGTL